MSVLYRQEQCPKRPGGTSGLVKPHCWWVLETRIELGPANAKPALWLLLSPMEKKWTGGTYSSIPGWVKLGCSLLSSSHQVISSLGIPFHMLPKLHTHTTAMNRRGQHSDPGGLCQASLCRLCSEQVTSLTSVMCTG